jgi:predicted transglutaminase-like cysteine proteinase
MAGWSWLPDAPNDDVWTDHSADVLAGRPWQGDCDDAVATVLRMLSLRGVPDSQLYRVRVLTDGGVPPADHMIGAAVDDTGAVWIVGDINSSVVIPATDCPYAAYDYQRLDEWVDAKTPLMREGFPWK